MKKLIPILALILFAGTRYVMGQDQGQPEIVWERTYGGSELDWPYSIIRSGPGEYIVAGKTKSFGTGEGGVYVLKIDGDGNRIWEKTYRGNAAYAAYSAYGIAQTTDGEFILAGHWGDPNRGPRDAYVLKIDGEGEKVWERTYGGDQSDQATRVASSDDGYEYVIAGRTNSFGVGGNIYLFKIDEAGNQIWEKNYGGEGTDYAAGIVESGDGGFVVAGTTYSNLSGRYSNNLYLLKINSDGEKIWEKIYGGNKTDEARSITQTTDGGFVVVCKTFSFNAQKTDFYVLKVDNEGNKVWERTYGGAEFDFPYSILGSQDGGTIVAGTSSGFYILKIDSRGEKLWEMTADLAGIPRTGRPYDMIQTDDNEFIITGFTGPFNPQDEKDLYLLKIRDPVTPVLETGLLAIILIGLIGIAGLVETRRKEVIR